MRKLLVAAAALSFFGNAKPMSRLTQELGKMALKTAAQKTISQGARAAAGSTLLSQNQTSNFSTLNHHSQTPLNQSQTILIKNSECKTNFSPGYQTKMPQKRSKMHWNSNRAESITLFTAIIGPTSTIMSIGFGEPEAALFSSMLMIGGALIGLTLNETQAQNYDSAHIELSTSEIKQINLEQSISTGLKNITHVSLSSDGKRCIIKNESKAKLVDTTTQKISDFNNKCFFGPTGELLEEIFESNEYKIRSHDTGRTILSQPIDDAQTTSSDFILSKNLKFLLVGKNPGTSSEYYQIIDTQTGMLVEQHIHELSKTKYITSDGKLFGIGSSGRWWTLHTFRKGLVSQWVPIDLAKNKEYQKILSHSYNTRLFLSEDHHYENVLTQTALSLAKELLPVVTLKGDLIYMDQGKCLISQALIQGNVKAISMSTENHKIAVGRENGILEIYTY